MQAAVAMAQDIGRTVDERLELHSALLTALIPTGHIKQAERLLEQSAALVRASGTGPDDPLVVRDIAMVKLAQGDVKEAARLLERALARWSEPEHPSRDMLEQILGQAWLEQRRYREAERLLREAIERIERLGRPAVYLHHEHGRALAGLGRFREAEHEFRWVLEQRSDEPRRAATTRHELARCLEAQGRLDEAEALLDVSLAVLREQEISTTPQYATSLYEKARLRRMRGDVVVAADLLREVLRLEERAFGRDHPTLIPTLSELAGALIDLGQPKDAEPLLRRAVRLGEKTRDGVGLATALGDLALVQAAQGFPQARDTARRALDSWSVTGENLRQEMRRELEAIARGASTPRTVPVQRGR